MSEIKPIRLPVRYDPKRGVIRDEMGNIVAEIPVGFGDRVTIEKRNAEIGEQIAAALNATLTEQLAEAEKWRLALESLTPNGSEFVNDLAACMAWTEKKRAADHDVIVRAVRERKEAERQLAEAQESLHKADGMANEINILVNENRALQAKVERFEAMLEAARYIEFDQWAIYNDYPFAGKPGDGKIRLFKKNETNQSFDVREFESVLEAYEARETFEATQNDSNGRGTQG